MVGWAKLSNQGTPITVSANQPQPKTRAPGRSRTGPCISQIISDQPHPVMGPRNRRKQQPEHLDHQQLAEPIGPVQRPPGQHRQNRGNNDRRNHQRTESGVVAQDPGEAAAPGLVERGGDGPDPVSVAEQVGEVVPVNSAKSRWTALCCGLRAIRAAPKFTTFQTAVFVAPSRTIFCR